MVRVSEAFIRGVEHEISDVSGVQQSQKNGHPNMR